MDIRQVIKKASDVVLTAIVLRLTLELALFLKESLPVSIRENIDENLPRIYSTANEPWLIDQLLYAMFIPALLIFPLTYVARGARLFVIQIMESSLAQLSTRQDNNNADDVRQAIYLRNSIDHWRQSHSQYVAEENYFMQDARAMIFSSRIVGMGTALAVAHKLAPEYTEKYPAVAASLAFYLAEEGDRLLFRNRM